MNVLKSFLSSLKDVPIIFPFGPTVTAFLPQDRLRVRGDFTKLASLIKLYAFANQHKLPRLKGTKSEVEPIVVTPEIVMQILPLGLKLMASMQVGLENRSLKLLDFLKKCELKKEWDLEQRRLDETPRFGTDEVFAVTSDMINEMARALGKSRKQILRYLKQWCDAGLMAPAERAYSSQPHEYILLHSISETERRLKKLTNEPESEIRAKLTIEGREFLKPILNEVFDETGEENLDIIEAFR